MTDYNNPCVFCNLLPKQILFEDDSIVMIRDTFPVTEYHTLFITKRHVSDYFDLTKEEFDSVHTNLKIEKEKLMVMDSTILGFNVGINVGEVAGQSINHVHIHLIPRRKGDVDNPRGGIRGVIPNKQKY